jgi:Ca2+-binding RTX toxin-like protein
VNIFLRVMIAALAVIILSGIFFASAANNTVPITHVDDDSVSTTIDDLAPSACDGLSLDNLIDGSGTIEGTGGNDLILGSTGADEIDGMGGDDCIVGGDGDDTLDRGRRRRHLHRRQRRRHAR